MLIEIISALRWRLGRIGFYVIPYYWVEERYHEAAFSPMGDESDLSFEFFDATDIKNIMAQKPLVFPDRRLDEMLEDLRQGNLCLGVKSNNEYVAWTWAYFNKRIFEGKTVHLGPHESYLEDAFTKEEFRGRNIAGHLRHRMYVALNNMGKNKFYSVSDVLNKPSIRFKGKLGAEVCWVGFCIILFQKYRWHWKIRSYAQNHPL